VFVVAIRVRLRTTVPQVGFNFGDKMWNYRLVQFSDAIGICEVYYDDNGKVMGRTDPLILIDEVDDLPNVLAMIAQAGKKEVLDE